mmetsp:Transcript_6313/g.13187  ORF Transcript_6313/g.13187 Transcript_6313/m.13187 type:complete len:377 (+) Transcript_6313:49-1179(+)
MVTMGGGVPKCVFVPDLGMFRVTSVKGKSFSTYGVIFPDESRGHLKSDDPRVREYVADTDNDIAEETIPLDNQFHDQTSISAGDASCDSVADNVAATIPETSQPQSRPQQKIYLFIEEALFLHERGLLEVYDTDEATALDSQSLFRMLPLLGVAFPVYLAYAHLRVQTYIVMRHTAERLDIVDALLAKGNNWKRTRDSNDSTKTANTNGKNAGLEQDHDQEVLEGSRTKRNGNLDVKRLKRRLRTTEAYAPAPTLLRSTDNLDEWEKLSNIEGGEESTNERKTLGSCIPPSNCPIGYDVYLPNSSFRRTNPGRPEFCVAIASFAEASPGFSALHALISIARGVPVRVATVADGGTVVMFSLTDYGVPPINEVSTNK